MRYKMPKVGDYMYCHTDLVMTDGLIAAKKGRAYKVDETALNGWRFTNEQDEDRHFIRLDEDDWFRPANAEEVHNQPRTYTEDEVKFLCEAAYNEGRDAGYYSHPKNDEIGSPEYYSFNAFWEANKLK